MVVAESTPSGKTAHEAVEATATLHDSESSFWVRLFRRLGVRWTKELDFVFLPFGIVFVLFVLALLDFAGQRWAGAILQPPVLLIVAVANIAWAFWALKKQAGTLGDRSVPTQNRKLHDAWRARTIAWDVVAIGLVSVGLLFIVWAGPSRFVPSPDLPVVEISVLVATVALLATFARYTAMAFSTDIDSLVSRLEGISRQEGVQRSRETERLAEAFKVELSRLLERVDKQIETTDLGLKSVTGQLEIVSKALAAQAKASAEIAAAQKAVVDAQREAEASALKRDEQRRKDAKDAESRRREQIAPLLEMELGWEGLLFHRIYLKLKNSGGRAEGLNVEARHRLGDINPRPITALPSGGDVKIDLGDVTNFDLTASIAVTVGLRDEDGNRYMFSASVGFTRTTGFWGQTKDVDIHPKGWIPMAVV